MSTSSAPLFETRTIDLGPVVVEYATDAGPRILGYCRHGGQQLFARLPTQVLQHPTIGEYRLLGGHRLWRAPEVPATTYAPDHGSAMGVTKTPDGLAITGVAESDGLTKTIRIKQRGEYTIVDHGLQNHGAEPITCAPWAITQLVTGGSAYLPQTRSPVDADGVLPNRRIICWPYTDLSHPEIEFQSEMLVIHGSERPYPTKVGQPNQRGWVAYGYDNEVFVKWTISNDDAAAYVDYGATVQCYRNELFVELETLGQLTTLLPHQTITHREIWLLVDLAGEPIDTLLGGLPPYPEL